MFGRRKGDDEIGPSKGIMKWVNRFFRFILYPFIHPKIFFGVVVLLVAAAILVPLLVYKVKFADMGSWYKDLLVNSYHNPQSITTPLKEKIMSKYQQMVGEARNDSFPTKQIKQEDIVDYEVEHQAKRSAFVMVDDQANNGVENNNNTESDGVKDGLKATPDIEIGTNTDNSATADRQVYFRRDDSLGLVYLDKPERVEGRATVINANEIMVGDKPVFMYGIYAQLGTENARKSAEYMMDNIDGKTVECYIGAYTDNKKATAICYSDGKSINHELVNRGFSRNVSLY